MKEYGANKILQNQMHDWLHFLYNLQTIEAIPSPLILMEARVVIHFIIVQGCGHIK